MKNLKLKKGDKVMIVSPAGNINPDYIEGAAEFLRKNGLEPVVAQSAGGCTGRFAGEAEQRLADIQRAFDDASVRAVLCSRGGYGCVQIIDKIDFSEMKKNPKMLVGFSDITVLHAALSNLRIPSLHAPMAKHLTENPDGEAQQALLRVLFGEKTAYSVPAHPLNRAGAATGTLVGGNLSVLYGLRGTRYDIRPKGKILFIEDLSEAPYHVDRMMRNLRLGGILENIAGLVVGQFTEMGVDTRMKPVYEIIADAVSEYDYPVCFDFPAGHVERNMPLVFGRKHDFSVSGNGVNLMEK